MMEKEPVIHVVYLAWLPYGIGHFHDFIDSYVRFPAGKEHTLVIAFNGLDASNGHLPAEYENILEENNISNVRFLHFIGGQDIAIYRNVAAEITSGYLLFVNTYSRFLAANWLKFYADNWTGGIGLIGASASYANYFTAIKTTLKAQLKSKMAITKKIDEIKYFVKIFYLYRNKFGKFPSPHIRTNAFFTSCEIFLSITSDAIRNKMDAYFFENGKNSLTVQIQKAGYQILLIDRSGKAYELKDWATTNIFWTGRQADLLISDNQTRRYEEAGEEERALLKKIAWG
ncbi:hypothetical protein [Ferruginibacter sp. HRS2-29]|uniref:hypothetical protein n=1 Tax=Ferruginibacter sp. HRS2-29 TaxID=2487334 RepID=UPI0020CD50C1|nr:hypothetical protein [Ferruginibacter sp. HRS2-29]MCP9750921.1 hypothetical protein [Ferruginibacter sp. HRS2-29]